MSSTGTKCLTRNGSDGTGTTTTGTTTLVPPTPPPLVQGECPLLWCLLETILKLQRGKDEIATPPPGSHLRCKNLVAKDKAGRYYMLVAPEAARADFPHIRRELKAKRSLSLVSHADVALLLGGAVPGMVSPFALCRPGVDAAAIVVVLHPDLATDGAAAGDGGADSVAGVEAGAGVAAFAWHVDNADTCVLLPVEMVLAVCASCGAQPAQVVTFTPNQTSK
jgi:hypothetical protein